MSGSFFCTLNKVTARFHRVHADFIEIPGKVLLNIAKVNNSTKRFADVDID